MRRRDVASLLLLGLIIWVLGTILYSYRGPVIFETTGLRYWSAFASSLRSGSSSASLRLRAVPLRSR